MTTPPTTTECPHDVACRNRYVWVQQLCECVCPPYFCPPGTERGNDCDCIPETTTTDDCQFRATCFGQQVWDEKLCDCVCLSNPGVCRNNYIWDPQVCDCLCLESSCPEGFYNGGDCECIPDPNWTTTEPPCSSEGACFENWIWDQASCSCVCPLDMTCPEGQINIGDCICVDDPNFSTTLLPCKEQECPQGYYWVQEACECSFACDYIPNCDYEDWDLIECGCKTTTQIATDPCDLIICSAGFEFNWTSCSCEEDYS